jgi:L,D-peptidoglycan transpeptidase YkuD (ErfK/YbiS/YcfS/YnhG family)
VRTTCRSRLTIGAAIVLAIVPAWARFAVEAQTPGAAPGAPDPVFGSSRQLILVVTDDWNAVAGTLRRFDRISPSASWTEVGSSLPVVVGRAGLAWGRGVRSDPASGDPIKKEGDGKAPAGAYRLGVAFGSAPQKPASWKVPYLFLSDEVECVDDVASGHYNRLISKRQVARADWKSSERMWEQRLYTWGLVVEHNTGTIESAGGSCIFMHIWSGPARGTAGCTAMAEPDLLATLAWLDPARTPVLVQLPRTEYSRLRTAWRLP